MIKGVHFLLTYMCNSECDHCFVYSGPNAKGTFTIKQIKEILEELLKIKTVKSVYFEGGEPFLYYPIMLEGIKAARSMGFKVGVVTNSYFGTSEEDILLWLTPLYRLGISDLSVSDDPYHYEEEKDNPAKRVFAAAKKLGMAVSSISIEKPSIVPSKGEDQRKGEPVLGGGTMLRGRAVEKLLEGLTQRPCEEFTECPHEELTAPKRVHVDPYGHVHLCQGLSMGNVWDTPFSVLVKEYHAESHPICGPLVKGGPLRLAEQYDVEHARTYVDACHFCYLARKALIDKFPQFLAPRQVYGCLSTP